MKNKKILKLKKDIKKWISLSGYQKNVDLYKSIWLKNIQSSVVIGKDHLGGPIFNGYWGDPIWVKGFYPTMNFDTTRGRYIVPVYFMERLLMWDPPHIDEVRVALCHPHVVYRDCDGDRVSELLPLNGRKLVSRIFDLLNYSAVEILYISTVVVPEGYHQEMGYETDYQNPYLPIEIEELTSSNDDDNTTHKIMKVSSTLSTFSEAHEFI